MPIAAVGVVTAPLGGMLNEKFGPRLPLVIGIVLFVAGLFGLTLLSIDTGYGSMWPYLVLLGVSMSLVVPVGMEAVISSAPERHAGVVSGIGETMGSLGPALGVASVATTMTMLVSGGLGPRLAAAGVDGSVADDVIADAESVAQGTVPALPGAAPDVVERVVRGAHEAFLGGFQTSMIATMVVLVVCLPLAWLVRTSGEPAEKSDDPAEQPVERSTERQP